MEPSHTATLEAEALRPVVELLDVLHGRLAKVERVAHEPVAFGPILADVRGELRGLRAELAELRGELAPVLAAFKALQQIPKVAKALAKADG